MWNARTRKMFEELGWAEQWRKNAFKKGKLEGIEKGKLEGIEKGKLEAARVMLAEGDSLEKISRVTGISKRTLKAKLSAQ